MDNFMQITVFVHPSLELVPLFTGMRERSIRDGILEHIQDDQ